MPEHMLTYYLRINGNFVQAWAEVEILDLVRQKRYCLHALRRLQKLLPPTQELVRINLELAIHQLELFAHGDINADSLRVCAEVMCAQDKLAQRYDHDASIPNLVSWCCEEALTPALTYPAWNLGALACAAHKRAGEQANVSAWGIAGLVQVVQEHERQTADLRMLVMEHARENYEQQASK